MNQDQFNTLRTAAEGKQNEELLALVLNHLTPSRVVLASSISFEDQILTHMLCDLTPSPRIITLDTGRLFEETYTTMARTSERYSFSYESYMPDAAELETLLAKYGPNCFYHSVERRKECCKVRKIHPLKRALSTADAWICGLRMEQSVTRSSLGAVEWDESNGIAKINPLYNWSEGQVLDYIKLHSIAFNPLQNQGFRSIGCAPCTRAIAPGDDIRSGRWWWEEPEHKECGLHHGHKR